MMNMNEMAENMKSLMKRKCVISEDCLILCFEYVKMMHEYNGDSKGLNNFIDALKRGNMNKEKLATKCHGLPGLIYYAIQLYNHNRNNLEGDNVLSSIDEAIDRERRSCNTIAYYKTITFRDLNHHEIRKYIEQQQNIRKWTTLFGHRRRGDTIKFVNELFEIYKRLVGDQSKCRIIENYERDFISHELIPYMCEHRPYTPYDKDDMKKSASSSNTNNDNHRNSSNNNKGGGRVDDTNSKKGFRFVKVFRSGKRNTNNNNNHNKNEENIDNNMKDEIKDNFSKNSESIENTKIPIEVFEDIITFWSKLVDVIMNPKIRKYHLIGSACYELRKNRLRNKTEQQMKDNYLEPTNMMHNDSTSSVSTTTNSINNISSENINQNDIIKNHFRIILGLITKNKALKIIQRYRPGRALIPFSRTTPGALAIVVSRGTTQNSITYRVKTVQTSSNGLVFTFDGVSNKGSARSLYDLVQKIANIKYVYTHRNGNVNDVKLCFYCF